jgi:hypothetical protein
MALMTNPLDALKNLKPWQQGAVAVGSIAVLGFVLYERKKKKAVPVPTNPSAAPNGPGDASAATSNPGEVVDPTTGTSYPGDSVDSETGLTYQQEIAEFGSVSAAEAADSGGSGLGQASLEYSGSGYNAGGYDGSEPVQQTGSTVTTNAQWMAEVETGLSEQGYSASDIGQGLAAYFASKPLATSSDGTSLYTMMQLAISEYGAPPTGSYPLLMGGKTPTPAAPKVKIPNVVGMDVEQAKVTLEAAGLVAVAPAGAKNVVHVVTGTTPAVGSSVADKSKVTLKYKSVSETKPPPVKH